MPAPRGRNVLRAPYSGAVAWDAPWASREEALAALDSAHAAFGHWGALPIDERVERVRAGIDAFERQSEEIARHVCELVGKPLAAARGEVEVGVAKMRTLCDLAAEALATERRVDTDAGLEYEVRRVPKGVIDVVSPWNYPVFVALVAVLPALLSGNAVSLRHATTPLVGEAFAKAFGGVHGGPGRLLVHLHTDIPTHDWLAVHSDIIAHRVFTGSTRGGRHMQRLLGERAANQALRNPFIQASLELGGNDAAYVHSDALLPEAVDFIAVAGRLHNTGQSCCATKRLLVHADVLLPTVERLAATFAGAKAGDPEKAEASLGPLYGGTPAAESLFAIVLDAVTHGARVVAGGEDITALPEAELRAALVRPCGAGTTFAPTLLLNAPQTCRAMREETFGPVLPVRAVANWEEAVEAVADSDFGLTAAVFTQSDAVFEGFAAACEAGTVYRNWANDVHARICWEGLKQAGNGSRGMGLDGFRGLTHTRSVLVSTRPIKVSAELAAPGPIRGLPAGCLAAGLT